MTTTPTVRTAAPPPAPPGGAARILPPAGEEGGAVGVEDHAPHDTGQGAPVEHFGWEDREVFDDGH